MGLLIPNIPKRDLSLLFRESALAALLFAVYGALHNQASFTISPEYFTDYKFDQFAWANVGLPNRGFASAIGALAAWPGGCFGVWFLGRYRVTRSPKDSIAADLRRATWLMLGGSILGAATGLAIGYLTTMDGDASGWKIWRSLGITDLEAFARTGSMHNGSYLGAIIVTALIFVRFRAVTKVKE